MKRIVLLVAVAAMIATTFAVPGTAMADQVPVVDGQGNPVTIDYFGNTVSLAHDDSGNPILVDGSGNPVSLSADQSGNPVLVDQSGNPVSDQSGNPIIQSDLVNALCGSLSSQEASTLVPGC